MRIGREVSGVHRCVCTCVCRSFALKQMRIPEAVGPDSETRRQAGRLLPFPPSPIPYYERAPSPQPLYIFFKVFLPNDIVKYKVSFLFQNSGTVSDVPFGPGDHGRQDGVRGGGRLSVCLRVECGSTFLRGDPGPATAGTPLDPASPP